MRLSWWLIGYLVGDSTLRPYGLRTSSAHPLIAKRLAKLLEKEWTNRNGRGRPLHIFKADDPEVVRIVQEIKSSGKLPKLSRQKLREFLAGYLDADGSVANNVRSFKAGWLTGSDWKIIKLILEICDRLGLKTTVTLNYRRGHKIRSKPIFMIYVRPIDGLPAVKVEGRP